MSEAAIRAYIGLKPGCTITNISFTVGRPQAEVFAVLKRMHGAGELTVDRNSADVEIYKLVGPDLEEATRGTAKER